MSTQEHIPHIGHPFMGDICRYLKNAERVLLWESVNGPIPEGMRVGWTCLVPYCGKLEHMTLVVNRNSLCFNWKKYIDQIAALRLGEHVRLDLPHERRPQLTTALNIYRRTCITRYSCLGLPSGGILVTNVGTWESLAAGTEYYEIQRPKVMLRAKPSDYSQPASAFYLGLLWNTSLHRRIVPKAKACSWKACPFPAIGKGRCHHHSSFFAYPISMTDSTLDRGSLYSPRNPTAPYTLAAEFPHRIESLERSLIFERRTHKGGEQLRSIDDRHKNMGKENIALQQSPTMRHMGHGSGHSKKGGLRSQKTKRKASLKNKVGGNHPSHDVEKRWSRKRIWDGPNRFDNQRDEGILSSSDELAALIDEQEREMLMDAASRYNWEEVFDDEKI